MWDDNDARVVNTVLAAIVCATVWMFAFWIAGMFGAW